MLENGDPKASDSLPGAGAFRGCDIFLGMTPVLSVTQEGGV